MVERTTSKQLSRVCLDQFYRLFVPLYVHVMERESVRMCVHDENQSEE